MSYSASFYKNKIASRYIPVDPDQIGIKITEANYYFSSVKYNGHFAILEINNGKVSLFNSTGNEISIPSIQKTAKKLKKDIVLAGELVVFKDGHYKTHMEMTAAIDDPENHDIRFAVFDLVNLDNTPATTSIKERFDWLKDNIPTDLIFPVEQVYTESRKDIITFYKEKIKTEEGVVVRSDNGVIYKIKPIITLDMVVLGYAEDPNSFKPRLRELLLGVTTESGDYQIVARCSSGFSEKERVEWINILEPLKIDSDYTEVSGAKTAFNMIKPEKVVEIQCLDLINNNTNGSISKKLLHYNKKAGFETKSDRNTISCISPVFVRMRSDKQPVYEDTGEDQIYHYVECNTALDSKPELVQSKVIIREVYKKEGKGGVAIRKFLALQTNKEQTGSYSPFVVVFTDFSNGRKTPLEQDLYLCRTKKECEERIKELIEENIKKGWEPHH